MEHLFDKKINRRGTYSAKWDGTASAYGDDVIPLSVADMDIQVAPTLLYKGVQAVQHGVFGYSELDESYYRTVKLWIERRYHWPIDQNWIVFCPRIVQAVSLIIQDFTAVGDTVMIHTPAYQPIAHAVEVNGRRLIESPLILTDHRYEIDFVDMEQKMKSGVKILLLCSPHNPTGRVWTKQELMKIGELCVAYNVLIVSDDIHADFIRDGHEHTIIATLGSDIAQQSIICTSPGKTFNLASMEIANIIIPNDDYRQKFQNSLLKAGIHNPTFLAPFLLKSAYTECDDWLAALLGYIESNISWVESFISQHMPKLHVIPSEGTYVIWVDCRELKMNDEQLKEWLIHSARVSASMGNSFGAEGSGFIRLNVATRQELLREALERIKLAYDKITCTTGV